MAMFGFVYLWYLMVVLLLEILARLPEGHRPAGPDDDGADAPRLRLLTLGSYDVSAPALQVDDRPGTSSPHRHPLGLPASTATLGFIFGR